MDLIEQIPEPIWLVLTQTVVPIVLIVVISLVVVRLARYAVRGIVKALLDREVAEGTAQELSAVEIKKRMDTLEGLGTTVIRIFVIVIGGVMILGELDLDIGPAVAGLGVVGIAVGFGTQSIVRDYFTGALILVENQFSKGDVITIAGVSGTVEDFSLRRTTLRDLDGVVHTVPNGEIKVASNRTRVWARINLDVTVAYGTDIEKATQVVNDVGKAMAAGPRVAPTGDGGAVRRTDRGAGRVRDHDQDPGPGPGDRAVGRRRRAAQAPARGVRDPRHRDPAAPAGGPGARPVHRPVHAGRRHPPGTDPGRPVDRHGLRRDQWSGPRRMARPT